ncbi:MAG: hypothetical protein MRK01_13550 [Candidatus Scalindua sp.]|nr:hypothetical protein [Candidatus Scalindua sp.]
MDRGGGKFTRHVYVEWNVAVKKSVARTGLKAVKKEATAFEGCRTPCPVQG